MNQLDVYYRALKSYRGETLGRRECIAQRSAVTKSNTESDRITLRRMICTVEEDWVNAIEAGLVHIEKAIKEERQFIRSNGEVIPIEKVKHVSKDSVEHLARHSNLITRYKEGEDVVPDQLYTVEKLSDYAVYENRFLYMLLCYLRDFITLRYNKIVESSNTYDADMTMKKTVKVNKRTVCYDVSLKEIRKDDEYLREHNSAKEIIDRIDLLLKAVIAFLGTPLMEYASKAPMLKPPITKTNVLKMNNNFKGAMALYEYVTAYTKPGYTIETKIVEMNPFRELVADELSETVLLSSFLTYEYSLDLREELEKSYNEEEARRREEEYKQFLEKLEKTKRRVEKSGQSFEEYIIMLEKQIRILENKCAELDAALEEIERLKGELAEARAEIAELQAKIEALSEELAYQKQKYIDDIAALKQAHAEEIARINALHAAEIERLIAEHTAEIERLNTEHAEEIERFKAEIRELIERYEAEIERINATHAAEIERLIAEHTAEIERLNALHAEEIARLIADHEAEVAEYQEELIQQRAGYETALRDSDREIGRLAEYYTDEVEYINAAHDEDMREAREAHEAEVAELNGQIADMKQAFADEIRKINEEHTDEVQKMRDEHAAEVEKIRDAHAVEVDTIKSAAADEAERHRQEKERIVESYRHEMDITAGEHASEIEGYKDIDRELRARIDELILQRDALIEEKRVMQAEIYAQRRAKEEAVAPEKDFTTRENFDELEREFLAFKKFYREEWKKTKRAIRSSTLGKVRKESTAKAGKPKKNDENEENG